MTEPKTEPKIETVSRAFLYALLLNPAQEAALQRQEVQLRRAWNYMVRVSRETLRECEYGRRTAVLAHASELLSAKKNTGQAASKSQKRAAAENITVEEALNLNRQQTVGKFNKFGPRRLGVTVAQEKVTAAAQHFYSGQKCLLYGLIQKFQKSCENWLQLLGTAEGPNYKKDHSKVAVQRQIIKGAPCHVGPVSDLSAMLGQPGKHCRTVWHRSLPKGAVIKQLAITGRPGRRMLVVFFNCERGQVIKPFPVTNQSAGIDTGYCMALTLVPEKGTQQDRLEYQPPKARDRHFLAKARRLQRKLDRQKRAANPDCYEPNGTWKKGKRAKNLTKGLIKTHQALQAHNEKLADVRRNHYHQVAYKTMQNFDHIALGAWRPPQESVEEAKKAARKVWRAAQKAKRKLGATGQVQYPTTKARRNRNRKGLDHAICMFESILKDKANLSATPKIVEIIEEPWTTQTCPKCGSLTGPVGPTNIVEWTCPNCDTTHRRKAGAAQNINKRKRNQ